MIGILCCNIDLCGGVENVSKRLDTEFNANNIASKIYSLKYAHSFERAVAFEIMSEILTESDVDKIANTLFCDNVDIVIMQLNSPYCTLANVELYKKLSKRIKIYSVLHNSPKSFLSRYRNFCDCLPIYIAKSIKTNFFCAPYAKRTLKKISEYSKFVSISVGNQAELKDYYGIDSYFIPNCFNLCISDDNFLEEKEQTVACVSRIDYEAKNFKLLLDAWNAVEDKNNWRLKIIGGGDKSILLDYISKHCIQNIDVSETAYSQESVVNFLKRNSILLLTSYHEGFPTVLMEGASFGNALITTKYDGFSDEIVKNGENGFVTGFDATDIAKKIQLLINDKDMLLTMQKKSLEAAREYMSEYNVVAMWKELF